MHTALRFLVAPALLVGWLGLAGPATAQVRDTAHFFTKEAVAEADRKIGDIRRNHKLEVLVETFDRIPADREKQFHEMSKNAFFNSWARERAREENVKGIYILICRNPGRVEVEVGNETQKRAFTSANRDRLAQKMVAAFQDKAYDQGLLDGIDYVRSTLQKNLGTSGTAGRRETNPGRGETLPPVPQERPRGGGGMLTGIGGLICIGIVVLLGIWLVFGLIRAFTGAGRYGGGYGGGGGGYGGGYGGGGGGGFMSGLLGGLFGAAAGNWMYDSFFRGGHSSGWGGQAYGGPPPGQGADVGGPPDDTDYSGSGGDFGDGGGGGGGDFGDTGGGGGDFGDGGGGGDFGGGGGDFGGGGGDFGGGGGDFSGGGGDF